MPNILRRNRNLLRLIPTKKNKRRKKLIWGGVIFLFAIITTVAIIGALSYPKVNEALAHVNSAKTELEKTQRQLIAQDFDAGRESLANAQASIDHAEDIFYSFSWLQYIPIARTQYATGDYVFQSADHAVRGIDLLIDVAEEVMTPFRNQSALSIDTITTEDKQEMLQGLLDAKPRIAAAEIEFTAAKQLIDRVPEHGVLRQIRTAIEPIKDQMDSLASTIDQLVPLSQALPSLLGYPDEKQYLLLFQNNTELRPTGGFIGTYGIIKLQNAEIASVESDNVYNLDEAARKAGIHVDPPGPLYQYNKVTDWFLRDSNWSPDFPTSAQKAIEFYYLEGGSEQGLDGVMAIDPTFISRLLAITGPITVRGIEFTEENFVERLQQHVTQGFKVQGIESADRKDIIGELGDILMDEIFKLPKTRWQELFIALETSLGEKHLLFWMNDPILQTFLTDQNWTGAIPQDQTRNDLLVVDANLASLKTDPAVSRSTTYTLTEDDDGYLVKIDRTYNNTGKLTWKTTRYRTYTRVYVPEGSTLISSSGQMIDCKIEKEGSVETSQDLAHTVFSFFACIEPGESKTFSLTYRLPDRFASSEDVDMFGVYIMKQPGTHEQPLTVDASFSTSISQVLPAVDNTEKISNTHVRIDSVLSRDAEYEFSF